MSKLDEPILKAIVTEKDGEISCTVEETNRIRALLGLKPLKINNEEKNAKKNHENYMLEKVKEADEVQIRDRIEKAKNKRLLREKLDGKSLGDIVGDDDKDIVSAADWVKRSRKKELTEKEKSIIFEKNYENDEEMVQNLRKSQLKYDKNDLKGLQITHSMNEFEMGQDVILTLADRNILDVDENGKLLGINEDVDVLENVNLAETERRLDREAQKKRLKQSVYSAYDDEEFTDGFALNARKPILPQYDPKKKKGPKLVLSEEGIVESNGNSGKNGNSASIDIKKEAQSLRMEFKDIQDFYSSKEFATFDKKKSVKMKEKSKKRKLRKKSTDDDDEITSATIIDELEQKISEDHNNNQMDHGSRKTHQPSNITIENENKRRLGYEKAVSNLAEKSKSQQIFLKSTGILNDDGADEDDAEILSSLAKARRLALLNAKNEVKMEMNTNENDDDVGAKIALEYVNKFKEVKNHQNIFDTTTKKSHEEANDAILNKGEDELEFDEIDAEGRRANGTLVFTSTTEFSTRLQARLNEKARAKSEAIIKASINDVKPITNMNEEMNIDHMKVSNEENDENSVDRSEMDLDDLDQMKEFAEKHFTKEEIDEQLSFVHQQPLVAKGMAATLALLKDSGELKKTEELAGRAKDARSNDPSSEHYGIKLDYRDEHGRKLTQKEAFRQLCYRFHGYGPGKKNKEKRLKAMEHASKSATSKDVDSGTMKSLIKAQEATGKAHLTVQGSVNSFAASASLDANFVARAMKKEKKK